MKVFILILALFLFLKSCKKKEIKAEVFSISEVEVNFEKQLLFLNSWLKEEPNNVEALTLRAITYLNLGLIELAVNDAHFAWKSSKNSCISTSVYLKCLLKNKQFKDAKTLIHHTSDLNCSTYEFYFLKGLTYYYNKEYEKAFDNFNSCISLMPTFSNAYLYKGLCYLHFNDTTAAERNLYLSLKEDSTNHLSYESLISLYRATNQENKLNTIWSLVKQKNINLSDSLYQTLTINETRKSEAANSLLMK